MSEFNFVLNVAFKTAFHEGDSSYHKVQWLVLSAATEFLGQCMNIQIEVLMLIHTYTHIHEKVNSVPL